jgi:hypothetical protein
MVTLPAALNAWPACTFSKVNITLRPRAAQNVQISTPLDLSALPLTEQASAHYVPLLLKTVTSATIAPAHAAKPDTSCKMPEMRVATQPAFLAQVRAPSCSTPRLTAQEYARAAERSILSALSAINRLENARFVC